MKLLQPRRTYEHANSDDQQCYDSLEIISMYGRQDDKKHSYSIYDSTYSIRGSISESKYDVNSEDQDTLLQSSKSATWFSGWRTGAYSAASIALCSLLINIAAAVWLSRHPNADSNLVEVFNGDCNAVSHMDIWVHLLINAISTLLLGGSNYCMQCLCAPTRAEIDAVHPKGVFLDIGVPSYRNLKYIARPRHVLWWALALSSLPLHLL